MDVSKYIYVLWTRDFTRRYSKEHCKAHLKIFVFLYTSSGFEDEMYTAIADGNSSTSSLAKAILPSMKCGKIMAMFNGR